MTTETRSDDKAEFGIFQPARFDGDWAVAYVLIGERAYACRGYAKNRHEANFKALRKANTLIEKWNALPT